MTDPINVPEQAFRPATETASDIISFAGGISVAACMIREAATVDSFVAILKSNPVAGLQALAIHIEATNQSTNPLRMPSD